MPTLLKTHGRPVLHGIVSSAIFQILWHGVSAVVGYVAGHFASIRGLAPQWAILIGAVVFFLLALAYNLLTGRRQVQQSDEIPEAILTRDSDQNCKEAWLHNIAEYEKTAIHNRVRVPECKVRNLLFDESPIEILFYISILNSSVYPVILEEAANPGRIKHVRKPFLYPPAVEDNNWECQHGNSQSFLIRQQLTDGEAARIRNTEQGTFQFDELRIMLKGGKGYENIVQPQPLKIPYWLGLNNVLYPARS